MDTNKPMALRLADKYEHEGFLSDHKFAQNQWCSQAAVELRRQHAEIETLRTGYNAARLGIESLQARIQELGQMARECSDRKVVQLESALARHVRSGKDWAMRVQALERTADKLREENAALQQRDDDWHKEHSNALVEMAKRTHAMDAKNLGLLHALTAEQDENHALHQQLAAIGAGGVEPLRKRECLHHVAEPAPSEWDVRGHLAASLTCWCRLTGQEAAELVELFQGRESQALAASPIDADAQRDAQRYRWLRKQHWNEGVLCVVMQPKKAVKLGCDCPSLDRLDGFIDAGRAAQGGV